MGRQKNLYVRVREILRVFETAMEELKKGLNRISCSNCGDNNCCTITIINCSQSTIIYCSRGNCSTSCSWKKLKKGLNRIFCCSCCEAAVYSNDDEEQRTDTDTAMTRTNRGHAFPPISDEECSESGDSETGDAETGDVETGDAETGDAETG